MLQKHLRFRGNCATLWGDEGVTTLGKHQRTKGHGFEREVAIQLRKVFPECKRHLENQIQEAKGFDLDNTGPFRFQCKAMARYAPISRIEEVQDLAGTIPALITKGDRKKPVVALYLEDFIRILDDIGVAFEGVRDPISENDF